MTESFFRRHSRHYPIRRGLSEEQIKAVKEQERQMIPLGRRGDPDDVVVAVSVHACGGIFGSVRSVGLRCG